MILGLAGILFGLLTGVPGAIMGMVGLKNVKNGEADNKGQALTGLIAGILTSLGSLIGGIIVIILIAAGAIGAGSGKTEPTSPERPGSQGQEPGGQEPGGSGGQEPGGSGGSSDGGDGGGKAPEIDNGINLAVRSKQVTAGSYAVPSEAQNSEYMFIEVSLKNNSSSDYQVPYPLITADLDGKNLDRVTDIDNQKKGAGDWPSSIAPGEEAIYQTGFLVTGADAKRAKVTVRLGGKKYDFKNS